MLMTWAEIDVTVGIHMEGDVALPFSILLWYLLTAMVSLTFAFCSSWYEIATDRRALPFDEYAVRAMDRVNLAALILHADANVLRAVLILSAPDRTTTGG